MKTFLPTALITITLVTIGLGQIVLASPSASSTYPSSTSVETASPSFGVNVDPIWLIEGGLGAKIEYFITDSVSIGLGGIVIPSHSNQTSNSKNDSTTTVSNSYKWEHNEVFIGTNIMLTGTLGSRGLYINPALGYQTTKISDFGSDKLSGELSSPAARLTMGYQWVIAQHLRLAAGGGFNVVSSSNVVVKDNSGKEVLSQKSSEAGGLALDLQIGYVF